MPSPFHSLPQEITDQIIEYIFHAPRSPPTSPQPTTNRKELFDIDYAAWLDKGRSIFYEPSSPSPAHLPLLLTNRETSQQTQAVISHIKKTTPHPDYRLDIMVRSGIRLFPTWLSVPWQTNRIATLRADVRLFGPVIGWREYRSQFGDGGRRGVHWHFYGLLERFLRYGPVGERANPQNKDVNRDMTVETLVMDFTADPLTVPAPEEAPKEMEETFKPKKMCEWISREFRNLLSLGYHHYSYGRMLYESIGTICMLVDGEPFMVLDLTEMLVDFDFGGLDPADVYGWGYRNGYVREFWGWKRETLERRAALGFKGVEADD